jgi:5-methylcytosine-specific restriction endonuclease McrA
MNQPTYTRTRSSDSTGRNFTPQTIQAVWMKARTIAGYAPNLWRMDACGAPIYWSHYGLTTQSTGWEIDHINPVANGGNDTLGNLQALQWSNNRYKGDSLSQNYCVVPGRS